MRRIMTAVLAAGVCACGQIEETAEVEGAVKGGAYGMVHSNSPNAPIGVSTEPTEQWNITGARNSVVHVATGVYNVWMPGLDRAGGNVQITNEFREPGPWGFCKPDYWDIKLGDLFVRVHCYEVIDRRLADLPFYVYYVNDASNTRLRYVRVGDPDAYAPMPAYESGGAYSISAYGPGDYSLKIPGGVAPGQMALVTPLGADNRWCIAMPEDDTSMNIRCHDEFARLAPAAFSFMLLDHTVPSGTTAPAGAYTVRYSGDWSSSGGTATVSSWDTGRGMIELEFSRLPPKLSNFFPLAGGAQDGELNGDLFCAVIRVDRGLGRVAYRCIGENSAHPGTYTTAYPYGQRSFGVMLNRPF